MATCSSYQEHRSKITPGAHIDLYNVPGGASLRYAQPASALDKARGTLNSLTDVTDCLANIICPVTTLLSPAPTGHAKSSKKKRVQGAKRTRAGLDLLGANVLFPTKKNKVSQKARLPRVEKRDPEWTETKMREQFVDQNGNFNWLKDPALRELAQQSGWSLTAIKSVRKKASFGRKHKSTHGPDPGVLPEHYEKTQELCSTSSFNLSKQQLNQQLLQIRFNHHVNTKGANAKYKAPCRSTQYRMLKKAKLVERAANSYQTEARDLAYRCPYTWITTAANFLAMEMMYGAPKDSMRAISHKVAAADLSSSVPVPDKAPSLERVTRPESVIYFDESVGRTFSVSFKAMKTKGTKHVKGLAGANGATKERPVTKALKQQYKFIWGCTAAGNQLPCLVGLKSKKIKQGELQIVELPQFNSIANSRVPPLLVIYNEKDSNKLVPVFNERIMDPSLEEKRPTLKDGEYWLVYQDGGEREHLKPLHETKERERDDGTKEIVPAYLEEQKAKRQVSNKLHVNSTGQTSLCDLYSIFKSIKAPDAFIKKVSAGRFAAYVKDMTEILDDILAEYFEAPKRAVFIETFAVLFFITLKSLTAEKLQENAASLGQCPRDPYQTLARCGTPLSQKMMDLIVAKLPLFAEEQIRSGRSSNATMDLHIRDDNNQIIRLSNGSDDINLRNDRVVIMAHEETVRNAIARLQAPIEAKQQKIEEKKEKAQARNNELLDAYDLVAHRLDKLNKGETQKVVQYESSVFKHTPTDVKCTGCSVWEGVCVTHVVMLRKHKLAGLADFCHTCDAWFCPWCAAKGVTHAKKCASGKPSMKQKKA